MLFESRHQLLGLGKRRTERRLHGLCLFDQRRDAGSVGLAVRIAPDARLRIRRLLGTGHDLSCPHGSWFGIGRRLLTAV